MRQIGTLTQQTAADTLAAYLITQGIAAQVDQEGEQWAIWVRDENQVQEARDAFRQYVEAPDDPRYQRVVREANALLQQETQRRVQAQRNVVVFRGRWSSSGTQQNPLTRTIMMLCILVAVLSNFSQHPETTTARRMLGFCDTMQRPGWDPEKSADRLSDIGRGQFWRLLTPIFLHGSLLHLVFNMLMFPMFASRMEDRLGTLRLAGIILLIGLLSNLAQGLAPSTWGTLRGGPFFVGISGVVYGLFGYVWMKTLYEPELGLLVNGSTVILMIAWLFLGLFGVLDETFGKADGGGGIANMCHVAGLVVGVALGYWPVLWRQLRGR